jgi:hypothetical protein
MRKSRLPLAFFACFIVAVAVLIPLRAAADDDDPPSRVARLGYISGSVSFQPAGTDDWVGAVVNRPLTTGDQLWSDDDSRAEMHIGAASIRIGSRTGFSFLNLSDDTTQIQLTQGTLRLRIKRLDDDETFEIDTPNLAFNILRTGVYRITVNEAGDATVVNVQAGGGEVTGEGQAFTVRRHEIGTFRGTDQLRGDIESYSRNNDDDFDSWCADRDRHEDLSTSARYVSPDVIGYEDLDDNGGWRQVSGYGMVWFPHTTIVGWAPYRYGHWSYVAPWGYTWVDDASWGFAPFHYGRWINTDGIWGWVPAPPATPGVVYVRPVYAPALVAWVGGAHFGVGIGVGAVNVNVGWFPLGPREVFVPSYPVSRTYVEHINVSNTTVNTTVVNNYYNNVVVNRTVVNNTTVVNKVTYVNQTVPGAVTATSRQSFTSAQSVSRNVVAVDQREVASAPVNAFTPSVAPAKQAVLGSGNSSATRPPAAVQNRTVVAKTTPPPPPVSFAKQQQAIQANGGRPVALTQTRQQQTAPQKNAQGVTRVSTVSPTATSPAATKTPAPSAHPGPTNAPPSNSSVNQAHAPNQAVNAPVNQPHPGSPTASAPVNTNVRNPNAGGVAAPLDQKHQQELEQLHQQQDAQRQQLEQQQLRDRQKLEQAKADQLKQQQLAQQQQRQLEQLRQTHLQQQAQVQAKQQQERQQQTTPPKSGKNEQKDEHKKP